MIEKPKRPKKIPNQDNKQPQTIQELIRRYDLENTKIYDFLDELVEQINHIKTQEDEAIEDNNEKINEIEAKITGRVLYEDETGTTGNITLSETVANFSEIKICYERITSAGVHYSKSITVDRPEGKKAVLDFVRYTGTGGTTEIIQIASKIVSISGTSITVDGSRYANITDAMEVNDFGTESSIYITKIIGYR